MTLSTLNGAVICIAVDFVYDIICAAIVCVGVDIVRSYSLLLMRLKNHAMFCAYTTNGKGSVSLLI